MLLKLLKGSAIYGLSPFIPKIISFLLLPVLTKYLTSTDFGIIGTITSVVGCVQVFSTLGLQVILPNYFYKCPFQYKIIWREIYGFLSLWMVAFAILQSFLLYFTIPIEALENRFLIIFLSIFSTVLFGPTALLGSLYYQLNIKPIPVAIRTIASGIVSIVINYMCVVVFQWGYLGFYIGTFAGTFLINASYWYVVNRTLGLSPIYKFKKKSIGRLLYVSIPTIPHYYTGYLLNSSNTLVLNYYNKPQDIIGELTLCNSIVNTFESIINAINQVVYPLSLKYIKERNVHSLKQISYLYVYMTLVGTFIYSLWAKEIFSILVSNPSLARAYKYTIILILALNYRPMYIICSNYFFYYEKTKQLLTVTFVSGIVSLALYVLLIPSFNIMGAVIGNYLGCLIYGFSGYLYKIYKDNKLFSINPLIFLFSQIALTSLCYWAVDEEWIFKIVVNIVILSVITFMLYLKIK